MPTKPPLECATMWNFLWPFLSISLCIFTSMFMAASLTPFVKKTPSQPPWLYEITSYPFCCSLFCNWITERLEEKNPYSKMIGVFWYVLAFSILTAFCICASKTMSK